MWLNIGYEHSGAQTSHTWVRSHNTLPPLTSSLRFAPVTSFLALLSSSATATHSFCPLCWLLLFYSILTAGTRNITTTNTWYEPLSYTTFPTFSFTLPKLITYPPPATVSIPQRRNPRRKVQPLIHPESHGYSWTEPGNQVPHPQLMTISLYLWFSEGQFCPSGDS